MKISSVGVGTSMGSPDISLSCNFETPTKPSGNRVFRCYDPNALDFARLVPEITSLRVPISPRKILEK
jgi:hypothetical protein